MASPPPDRRRTYADWYVWAARNLTATSEIRHACAEAATEATDAGTDPAGAARTAAQNRSGPGWTTRAEPGVRSYAEWYDWARTTLGLTGEPVHTAAAAALLAMEGGGDATSAAEAARRSTGSEQSGGSPPLPAPAPPAAAPLPPSLPSGPFPGAPPPGAGLPPPPTYAPPGPKPPPGYPPAGYSPIGQPPPPLPSQAIPSAYGPAYPAAATGTVLVPVWVAVVLGIGCGLSLLVAIIYAVILTQPGNDRNLVIGSFIFGGVGLLMFASSLVAIIGIVRRASWARVMSIVAGAAFCLSCVGIVLGLPVIIGSAIAHSSPPPA